MTDSLSRADYSLIKRNVSSNSAGSCRPATASYDPLEVAETIQNYLPVSPLPSKVEKLSEASDQKVPRTSQRGHMAFIIKKKKKTTNLKVGSKRALGELAKVEAGLVPLTKQVETNQTTSHNRPRGTFNFSIHRGSTSPQSWVKSEINCYKEEMKGPRCCLEPGSKLTWSNCKASVITRLPQSSSTHGWSLDSKKATAVIFHAGVGSLPPDASSGSGSCLNTLTVAVEAWPSSYLRHDVGGSDFYSARYSRLRLRLIRERQPGRGLSLPCSACPQGCRPGAAMTGRWPCRRRFKSVPGHFQKKIIF